MHRVELNRQIIQAKHFNERKNDAPRRLRLRRINRHEKAQHKDKSSKPIGRLHILVEHRQAIEPLLHNKRPIVEILRQRHNSNLDPIKRPLLGPTRTFLNWSWFPYNKSLGLHV